MPPTKELIDPGRAAAEPSRRGRPRADARLLRIYGQARTIATIEGSASDAGVASYLTERGYRIVRVRPGELADVELRIDMVVVFAPAREIHEIVRQTILIGARVLWFQPGTATVDAAGLAQAAGLTVVVNRCIRETYRELGPKGR